MKILSMPGASATPVITGLTFVVGRCTYVEGGYIERSNGYVDVDITINITNTGTAMGYVTGFPLASGTGNVTAVTNNLVINCDGVNTTLQSSPIASTGNVRFVGSYAKA